MTETVHECLNDRCPLGSRDTPGYFTGGLSEHGRDVLGLPPDSPTGEGVCPNCGTVAAGEATPFVPLPVGADPHQHLHDEVAAELAALERDVANPETPSTPDDLAAAKRGAQAVLEAKIETAEGADDA